MDNKQTFAPLVEASTQLQELLTTVCSNCGPALEEAVKSCCTALRQGNKILFFGNGGSATQAQHLAAELKQKNLCQISQLREHQHAGEPQNRQ